MLAYPTSNNNNNNSTPIHDPHGRQKNFAESAIQRKERIEFLKRREWVRRVAEWVRETSVQKDYPIFGRSSRSCFPFSSRDAGIVSQPSIIPFPCAEEVEEEPYVIYSSSPNSSLSSLPEEITPVLPLNSGPPPSLSLPVPPVPQPAQRRSSGHHRRHSSASLRGHARKQSLSSICEVPEED
ncbi:hypothetical protein EV363DRAFT_1225658 [Boletus edulis]|nr:hypothetical protein EV363DRAFT_1225658 [Boletus edulis]